MGNDAVMGAEPKKADGAEGRASVPPKSNGSAVRVELMHDKRLIGSELLSALTAKMLLDTLTLGRRGCPPLRLAVSERAAFSKASYTQAVLCETPATTGGAPADKPSDHPHQGRQTRQGPLQERAATTSDTASPDTAAPEAHATGHVQPKSPWQGRSRQVGRSRQTAK